MNIPSLLDAIRVVKENERIASESYATAANDFRNPWGKELFKQLSAFEQFHLETLTALVKSLEETGKFIDYEGKEFPLPPIFEIKAAQEANTKSVMRIVTEAIELETQAEKAYAGLAGKISDPQGHQMFSKLSEEEHKHYIILWEAYWTLTNMGTWTWIRP
jgi:rubrerythrin